MELKLRHIGGKIIEMTVESNHATISEHVTNGQGLVDDSLIEELRAIADELEEHNADIKQNNINKNGFKGRTKRGESYVT